MLALCDNDTVVRSHELKIQTDAMYLAEIYVYSATDIFACTFFFCLSVNLCTLLPYLVNKAVHIRLFSVLLETFGYHENIFCNYKLFCT